MSDLSYMASPSTPTARKAPSTPTPSKARNSAHGQKSKTKTKTESTPTPARKRKTKVEASDVSPKNASSKGKGAGGRGQPSKKQKMDDEEKKSSIRSFPPHLGREHQPNLPTPHQTPLGSPLPGFSAPHQQHQQQYMTLPSRLPQSVDSKEAVETKYYPQPSENPQVINQPSIATHKFTNPGTHTFDQLIMNVLNQQPLNSILPAGCDALPSMLIDKYAHVVWNICLFRFDMQLHDLANKYASVMSEHRLRTLANMNLLPSWFFVRTRVVSCLTAASVPMDDSIFRKQYKDAEEKVAALLIEHGDALERQVPQVQYGEEHGSLV